MKLILLAVVIASAIADRLDNTYLPPQRAHNSGGNGNFLSTPFKGGAFGGSLNYNQNSGASSFGKTKTTAQTYSAPQNYNAPQAKSAEASARILRFDNNNDGLGSYSYGFETDNGINVEETGELKNAGGPEGPSNSVRGSYSYTGLDGIPITVTYVADENGFQASGEHLPTPPPIPEAILKSLELIAKSQSSGSQDGYDNDDGQYVEAPSKSYLQPKEPSRSYLQPSQPSRSYLQPQSQHHHQQQHQQQPSRSYLQPNQPSFNSRSGYQY